MLSSIFLLVALQAAPTTNLPEADKPNPLVAEIDRVGSDSATKMEISVDAKGKVTGCVVVESSGSADLDEKACNLIIEKAKFGPRIDPQLKMPIAYSFFQRVVWRIEE